MTDEVVNLIEDKIRYENLKAERDELLNKKAQLDKQRVQISEQSLSKFLPLRVLQIVLRPIKQLVMNLFGIKSNNPNELALSNLSEQANILDDRIKDASKEIKGIEKDKAKDFSLISKETLEEYRTFTQERKKEVEDITYEARNNPSMILKEFSEIKGFDEPINRHKILDYAMAKMQAVKERKIQRDLGQETSIAFKYDGKEFTSKCDGKRNVYSLDFDIKDIEMAISFAMNENVVFDFDKMSWKGETFTADIKGNINADFDPARKAIFAEYGERLGKMVREICKEKHPSLITGKGERFSNIKITNRQYRRKDEYKGTNTKFVENEYNQTRQKLSSMLANKQFVESKVVTEYNAVKEFQKKPDAYIVDYTIQKYLFVKNGDYRTVGVSFEVDKKGNMMFENNFNATHKCLSTKVGIKDIEAAVSTVTKFPVHFDTRTRTFKSVAFELDSKGIKSSDAMTTKEYKRLETFAKEYIPKLIPIVDVLAPKPVIVNDIRPTAREQLENEKTIVKEDNDVVYAGPVADGIIVDEPTPVEPKETSETKEETSKNSKEWEEFEKLDKKDKPAVSKEYKEFERLDNLDEFPDVDEPMGEHFPKDKITAQPKKQITKEEYDKMSVADQVLSTDGIDTEHFKEASDNKEKSVADKVLDDDFDR